MKSESEDIMGAAAAGYRHRAGRIARGAFIAGVLLVLAVDAIVGVGWLLARARPAAVVAYGEHSATAWKLGGGR